MKSPLLLPAVFGASLLVLAPAYAQTTPTNLLTNPTLQDADGDKQPDKWRASAPAEGDALHVRQDAGGGVQILDQDKENGAGFAQYVAIEPGHKYKFTAQAKGSGNLWLYLQFLDAVPAKEGEIAKHRLSETRQNTAASPDFKEFSVQATAPATAKQARVWFYCPKIGVTDTVVKDAVLEDLGAVAVAPVAAPVAGTPAPAVVSSTLANPTFKDADADTLPDDWRVFPEADGTATKVAMTADGAQITDTDKSKGIGIQQTLPAQAGVEYIFGATLKGTGNISLNFQFLSDKPARDSDLKKVTLAQPRTFGSGTPEGKETVLKATAPAGTKFMRVWLYSPNIGVTDVVVTKVRLESGAVTAVAALPALNDKLIFVGDFETGDYQGWETQFPHSTTGSVVTTPVRAGKYAERSELTYADFKTYGDSRNRRCEILKQDIGRPGQERWYGFSVYLPKDWRDEIFDIVMQIHNHPDPGEGPKSPIMTLETAGDSWKVNDRWDKEKISKPAKNGAGGTITSNLLWTGPYETEKWTDWVFHVKWSLDDDGLVEVWKDGVKVVTHNGPNCYNDDKDFYFKMGVYKPAYRVTAPPQRVIFHDEVRIGNEKATYQDVAPGGLSPK
jgi:hypothetical protein